jgi:two-component system response regulator CssR
MYKIALVEDEKNLANLVVKYLEANNYEVTLYTTGEEAISNIDKKIDLWILDIMLPGEISGFDLLKALRYKEKNIPIIFTSARDKDIDKIVGLELGGDDYLAKPYSIRELVLRVKNIITRTYQNDRKISNSRLIIGEYEIDKERRSVSQNGEVIQLTSKEYDLLLYFVNNIGMAFSREQILNKIWGDNYFGSDRVVDDLLRRLRQKLPLLNVETIYGYGYRLTV